MWLQNTEDGAGMALQKMMILVSNQEEWKGIVCQLQLANETQTNDSLVLVLSYYLPMSFEAKYGGLSITLQSAPKTDA